MLEYIQILTILGASLLEVERFRGAPQTNFRKLLAGYSSLFKFFLAMCSASLVIFCVVWALQSSLIQITGWGLLGMGVVSFLIHKNTPNIYKAVWFIRFDSVISLGLLGLALYLKVKELF